MDLGGIEETRGARFGNIMFYNPHIILLCALLYFFLSTEPSLPPDKCFSCRALQNVIFIFVPLQVLLIVRWFRFTGPFVYGLQTR